MSAARRWPKEGALQVASPRAQGAHSAPTDIVAGDRNLPLPGALPDLPPPWACAFGDDPYGLWAEFTVGDARQRMRWVEPGTFRMGSPDDEAERADHEGPQHLVQITRGFWLADTACTQALWLAVMGGKNPSGFADDLLNPVEQVSWDDVVVGTGEQGKGPGFFDRLREWLPGSDPALPTEAQWEYACRAGSGEPFAFGKTVTTDQVNFDGNYPYGAAPKGPYRNHTVSVKALPANRWGLYQMHGNVWEWCADPLRDYAATAAGEKSVVDPGLEGEAEPRSARRAVRGGSWLGVARGARSAYRRAFVRSVRRGDLGFRLALRS